jgi:heme exporter protein A
LVRRDLTERSEPIAAPVEAAPPSELVGEGLACRRGERMIFAGVSFRLACGGALFLTGANGSGKSSLLRLVAGLLRPAAGRLLWGGTAIAADPALHHARLHYVGHLDALKAAMTPREMLGYWASLRGYRLPRAAPALDQALAAFGLDPIADWPCRWLSAGQRRRVALARLLAVPAPLWLLDEPTTALDEESQARLEAAIEKHRTGGGMAMIATHSAIALDVADVLNLGAFVAGANFDPAFAGQ